ncbi:hypothetical protein Plhal304r1_c040g0118111 [Plasmopara halstedii]
MDISLDSLFYFPRASQHLKMKIIATATILGMALLHVATPTIAAVAFRPALEADETNKQQQDAQDEERALAAENHDATASGDWNALLADRETRALAYILEAADIIDEEDNYEEEEDDYEDEDLLASGGRRRALADGGRRRALANGGRRRALANGGRRRALANGGRRRALADGGRRRALADGGRRRALADGGRRRALADDH